MKKQFRILLLALLIVPCLVLAACGHKHTYEWQKDATHHWQICTDCDKEKSRAAHIWDNGVVLDGDEATLLENGTKTFTCTVTGCGATKSEVIATSLSTLTEVDDAGLYSMTYMEDYKFDEFLETGVEGVSPDIELANFLENTLLDGFPVSISVPGIACSTFSGQLEESGDRIFARNFDNASSPTLIVTTNPVNGYKSISTVKLGFIGFTVADFEDLSDKEALLATLVAPYIPLDGINEQGLAIGVLQINYYPTRQADEDKINLTTTTMIRLILDQAATVDEAIALMEEYNMNDSLGANFHYQIADKTGKSVVVEYINNVMYVIDQEDGEDYHYATNFLLHSEAPTHSKGGVDRYNTLAAALAENDGVFADEQDAMDLLAAVQQGSTCWSIIYNLDELTIMFVYARQYTSPAYAFAL